MKPLVERLAKEYEGTVETRQYIDGGDAVGNELAARFGIEYVPTFVFVNSDGTQSGDMIIGGATEAQLRERIDALK